jgi:hypothetical protein
MLQGRLSLGKRKLQVRFLPDYKRLLGRPYLSTRGTGIDFTRIKDAPG